MSKPAHYHCYFCENGFTVDDHRTGSIVKNEHGQSFHIACYSRWCALNPTTATLAPLVNAITQREVAQMPWPDEIPG